MNVTHKINPFPDSNNGLPIRGSAYSPQAPRITDFVEGPQKGSFGSVMTNLIEDTNKTLVLPDDLMARSLSTGDVDIHEVMIANTKADIAVNIASQVVTKVIQAYERVQQIQV